MPVIVNDFTKEIIDLNLNNLKDRIPIEDEKVE